MEEFSTNGMGLHVSDLKFDSSDYIREFEEFQATDMTSARKTKVIDAQLVALPQHATEVGKPGCLPR